MHVTGSVKMQQLRVEVSLAELQSISYLSTSVGFINHDDDDKDDGDDNDDDASDSIGSALNN